MNINKSNELFFIAEIGINHNGDLSNTQKLIDAAYVAGWNSVKFQKRNPDVCVPEAQKKIPKVTPWGEMAYIDYKKKIEFGKPEYDFIDKYCKSKKDGMIWSASVWDLDSLNFLMEYNPSYIKIPSALLNNLELISESSKTETTIILSTGMSEISEIDTAVNLIKKYSNPIILHTNSSYPSPPEEINLSTIPFFKERYNCKIGYSGHEYNLEPSVLAVAMGAELIERHITLSHDMWGTDQKSSLTLDGMIKLINRCKNIKKYVGSPRLKPFKSELEAIKRLKKI